MSPSHACRHHCGEGRTMGTITAKDGTHIFYKDWGAGRPVVFSHGWPLNADVWDSQMVFMASNGFRAIAHDRRGNGRSSQPWNGNEKSTDRKSAVTGRRVAVRVGRVGARRVKKKIRKAQAQR